MLFFRVPRVRGFDFCISSLVAYEEAITDADMLGACSGSRRCWRRVW